MRFERGKPSTHIRVDAAVNHCPFLKGTSRAVGQVGSRPTGPVYMYPEDTGDTWTGVQKSGVLEQSAVAVCCCLVQG